MIDQVAEERIKIMMKKLPEEPFIAAAGESDMFTPEQILKQVQTGTGVGKAFEEAEKEKIKQVKRLLW